MKTNAGVTVRNPVARALLGGETNTRPRVERDRKREQKLGRQKHKDRYF